MHFGFKTLYRFYRGISSKYLNWHLSLYVYASIHRNRYPGETDGISPENEGIHDFTEKQKCEEKNLLMA
jgi:hypothetical protein